jgi:hypothetical protein
MNNRGNVLLGLIFVVIGGLFLLDNLNIIHFNLDIAFLFIYFWPMFIIIPGFLMNMTFFQGRNSDPGILVPGGILLTVGATCQISMLFNIWDIMWPGFILSVAVGLFELYLFGTRERALLIPVGILGGLSLIFFTTISLPILIGRTFGNLLVPGVLILIGAAIIFKGKKSY